jgi:hypothetical protein
MSTPIQHPFHYHHTPDAATLATAIGTDIADTSTTMTQRTFCPFE